MRTSPSKLHIKHDPVADAVWVVLRDGQYAETREFDSRRLFPMPTRSPPLSPATA